MKTPLYSIGDRVAFKRIAFDSIAHVGYITDRYMDNDHNFLYDVKDGLDVTWIAVPESTLIRIVES